MRKSTLIQEDAAPSMRMIAGSTTGAVNLEFSSMLMDWPFQLPVTDDLASWTNYSDWFMPGAGTMARVIDSTGSHRFWRLQANP